VITFRFRLFEANGTRYLWDHPAQSYTSGSRTFFSLNEQREISVPHRDADAYLLVESASDLEEAVSAYFAWQEECVRRIKIKHLQFLSSRDLPYAGSNPAPVSARRTDRCYACHSRVDSAIHEICTECALRNIICPSCGACGCGFADVALRDVAEEEWGNDDVGRWCLPAGSNTLIRPDGDSIGGIVAQRRSDYEAYIHTSSAWRGKRNGALRNANYRCERCGSSDRLHVHHKTYVRFRDEVPGDLEVLCEACHFTHHGYIDTWVIFVTNAE
jgi:hypothetical protein